MRPTFCLAGCFPEHVVSLFFLDDGKKVDVTQRDVRCAVWDVIVSDGAPAYPNGAQRFGHSSSCNHSYGLG